MSSTFPQLSQSFYDETPALRRIRDAANSRRVAPDAVLGAILCRVAASTSPSVLLDIPTRSGLNFITALIGESGDGKSKANRVACELLPDVCELDGLPIGSGEGLIDVYMETFTDPETKQKTKRQGHECAYFYFDEGEMLLRHRQRQDTTIEQTLRSAWSGSTIGTTNADAQNRRLLKNDSYRFALVMGLQPTYAAQLLLDDSGGTPQRFLFVSAVDAYMPDSVASWRGVLDFKPRELTGLIPVDREIIRLMDSNVVKRHKRIIVPDPLDTHRDLMTLKVAALLAILDGVEGVDLERFNRAVIVYDNSRTLRLDLLDRAKIDKRTRLDERADDNSTQDARREENRRDRDIARLVDQIGKMLVNNGPLPLPQIKNRLGRDRDKFPIEDLIDAAIRANLIVRLENNRYGPRRAS